MKEKLFGKTLEELKAICKERSYPAFTARQLSDWMYKKDVTTLDQMTNIPRKIRDELADNYDLGLAGPIKVQVSSDGTKKYLYPSGHGKFIETAYIPEKTRNTLCISSQIGCKMGCLFCMTARQGFQGNLSAGEILNQIRSLPEKELLTNIVYMGMGEPLDNLSEVLKSLEILTSDWGMGMSPKRITVSSIGLIPEMRQFLEESPVHLAISLHTPFEEERKKLMPVENVYPLKKVLEALKEYDLGKQRRISFEYIMFKGLNDTRTHVNELVRLLHGIRCRINLIRFHPIPGTPLEGSEDATIMDFRDRLIAKGITTTIRASRGQDIYAACGLLSTRELVKRDETDH